MIKKEPGPGDLNFDEKTQKPITFWQHDYFHTHQMKESVLSSSENQKKVIAAIGLCHGLVKLETRKAHGREVTGFSD
jgi:hypothetical protein